MTKPPRIIPAAAFGAYTVLRARQREFLLAAHEQVAELLEKEPNQPHTVAFALNAALVAGYSQGTLHEITGVRPTTLMRWASGSHTSRDKTLRTFCARAISTRMAEDAAKEITLDIPDVKDPLIKSVAIKTKAKTAQQG